MRTTSHQARGTTHLPVAMDVARPSDVLAGRGARPQTLSRWLRPLWIVAATAAALALLVGAASLL